MPANLGGNAILPVIAEEIEQFMQKNNMFEDDVIGIGVGIPGPVNASGVVNKCVNLGWGVFNLDRDACIYGAFKLIMDEMGGKNP